MNLKVQILLTKMTNLLTSSKKPYNYLENNDLNCNDFHSENHLAFAPNLMNRSFIFKGERRETNFEYIVCACHFAKCFHGL